MPLIHVALTVSDPAPSAAFNGEYSGRTERLDEDDHRLILGSGDGSELALSQGKPITGGLPRANHFGFRLADEAPVRASRDCFRAAGIVETEWQDDGRFVHVRVADPDRCRVEVYAH